MIKIEVPNENDAFFDVELDGKTWYFNTRWNDAAKYWTLSIFNADRKLMLAGLPILRGTDMLHLYKYMDIPQKPLRAIMTVSDPENPSRYDFRDGKAKLIYED